MRRVLGDLTEIGYDSEWHVIPASSVGAPHRRDRVWIIAQPQYPNSDDHRSRVPQVHVDVGTEHEDRQVSKPGSVHTSIPNPSGIGLDKAGQRLSTPGRHGTDRNNHESEMGNPNGSGLEGFNRGGTRQESKNGRKELSDPGSKGLQRSERVRNDAKETEERAPGPYGSTAECGAAGRGQADTGYPEPGMGLLAHGIASRLPRFGWLPEPGIGRVATGVPDRVNKLKALGNGLVWQIPYAIGQAIMERES